MKNFKKIGSMLLALSLVCGQIPVMEAKAAENGELTFTYEGIGNTGAEISITSGQEVTASVEDTSIATAQVNEDGDTITVTGAEGAVGIAKVTIAAENTKTCVVEVPIGYTTFVFDGDDMRIYEGSSDKYEINTMNYAEQTSVEDVAGTQQEDGSILYSNTEDTKLNVDIKKKGGTFVFTGQGNDMCISVKKEATGAAELLLAGLDLTASYTAPIVIKKDSEDTASATITALEGHTNTLTDTATNNADVYGDTEDGGDGSNAEYAESACIKAKAAAKVTLNGKGALTLNCKSKNAVKVGESGYLVIEDLDLNIVSAGHGISSDNTLTINSGNITIDAASDAMRTDPDAVDATAGCAGIIHITGGNFDITAGSDGIQAAQDLNISGGNFEIQTGAGYNDSAFNKDTMSCKGLKASFSTDETTETTDTSTATNTIEITGGTFALNTADDAVHSDAYVVISGGDFTIQTGDDGVHADTSLTLGAEGGLDEDVSIAVETAYEGLEGGCVYLYSGTYHVNASDDGINAAGDSGTTDTEDSGDSFNPGGGPGRPGQTGGGAGMVTSGCNINISGGNTYVNVDGDGLDANDSLNITGGKTVVFGAAASSDNQPLDCDGTITINGGTVFAAGSAGMAVSISSDSQNTVTYGSSGSGMGGMGGSSGSTISAGQTINVINNGTTIFNIKAPKNVNYVLYSSPEVTSSGWSISADTSDLLEDSCQNGHSYDDGVVTTKPSCTKLGVRTYTCTVCSATKTESEPMTDHVYGEYVSNNDATTEADGTKTARCVKCNTPHTIVDEGSRLSAEDTDSNGGNAENGTNTGNTETGTDTNNGNSETGTATNTENSTGNTGASNTENTETGADKNTGNGENVTKGTVHADAKSHMDYKVLSTTDGKKTVSCEGITEGTKITKAVIPATVTIGDAEYKVTKISAGAFKNATTLKTVVIGKNMEEIGDNAFYKCKKLTKITIPSKVTKIGKKAFYNCKSLKKITVKTKKLKKVGSKAITGIHKKAVIKVPKKKLTAYKKLFNKKAGYKKTMKIKKS